MGRRTIFFYFTLYFLSEGLKIKNILFFSKKMIYNMFSLSIVCIFTSTDAGPTSFLGKGAGGGVSLKEASGDYDVKERSASLHAEIHSGKKLSELEDLGFFHSEFRLEFEGKTYNLNSNDLGAAWGKAMPLKEKCKEGQIRWTRPKKIQRHDGFYTSVASRLTCLDE